MMSYTMTHDQAERWESEDARVADQARREVIAAARALRVDDDVVEIYLPDGPVVEVIQD